tara:strand:+ start:2167 stop:2658 length:492 start_codon:yes stop_codon:yes gene_type:complete
MAFLVYTFDAGRVTGAYDRREDIINLKEGEDMLVFEMEWDKTTDLLACYELSSDKQSLVNPHAGKTMDEQRAVVEAVDKERRVSSLVKGKTAEIKGEAKRRLEEIEWKKQRAKDLDIVNGNTDAMTAYLNEREAIRTANNAHEAVLAALTEESDIFAFDPKAF